MEFVNRTLNAAINIRRFAMLGRESPGVDASQRCGAASQVQSIQGKSITSNMRPVKKG